MKKTKEDELRHKARKKRIRFKIGLGTAERPRITVFKSNRNFYAQVIDDEKGFTIASISTLEKNLQLDKGSENLKKLGNILSLRLKEKGVNSLVFDRNGYKYHGVIMNFATSLREAGISF